VAPNLAQPRIDSGQFTFRTFGSPGLNLADAEIAGYAYRGDTYTPLQLLLLLTEGKETDVSALEPLLDDMAEAQEIDRADSNCVDPDDFPKAMTSEDLAAVDHFRQSTR